MNIIPLIKQDKIIQIVLIFWFSLVVYCSYHIPYDFFSHDFGAHVEYTRIIAQQYRIPSPNEGWETHQQPLFYLIASLLVPDKIESDLKTHANYVKAVSAICGAITLVVFSFLLQEILSNSVFRLLILLFITTTPKFVFLFTTYNNDSMAAMFSVLIIATSYFLHKNWSKPLKLTLLVASIAGLYTKLTVLMPMLIIISLCARNIFLKKQPLTMNEKGIIKILILSITILLPWTLFHNYPTTGKLLPSLNFTSVPEGLQISKEKLLSVMLPTSILENEGNKWLDPWVYPWPNPASKRNDYWSYVFITSVIGEFIFKSPEKLIVWLILFVHLFAYFIAVKYAFKSAFSKLALIIALSAHLGHLGWIYKTPFSCNMDYRYISWSYVSWVVLYLNALNINSNLTNWFYRLIIIGIVLQIYFLLNVIG